MNEHEYWKTVQDNEDRNTQRLPVPGGWIYIITEKGDYGIGILQQHAVFVPAPFAQHDPKRD